MKAAIFSLTLLGTAAAGLAAQEPAEPSYTYLSLEWEHSNVHEGSRSLTPGWSIEFADPIHFFGGVQWASLDVAPGVEADRLAYLLGVGYKLRVGEGKTMQFRGGYASSDTDVMAPNLGTQTVELDGYYAEVGIRTLPWGKWELDAFLARYVVGDDGVGPQAVGNLVSHMLFVTLEHRVTKHLGINISGTIVRGDGKSESVIFGTRFHF